MEFYIAGTGSHKQDKVATQEMQDASGPTQAQSHLRVIRRAPWDTGIGASVGVTDNILV